MFFITKISPPLARDGADVRGKYYLNENYSEGDLLITKVPRLEDMITGPIISDLDPGMGNEEAPVTIVIFSDYQCGFCQKQEQALKELMSRYEGKIRLIRKDYPETDENSISFLAAAAGRCAQEQKKFWEYHDLLFQNSGGLNSKIFFELAKKLNLNINQFNYCLSGNEAEQLIKDNIEEADALNISGVPFIYVNDQEVMGEITFEELRRIVEIEFGKTKN
ncbi:MAG: thioredoxin domain-containing protein [Candidatus Methanoperedens sp.]|nr:thioredoxin domain-containing protein [Candidatus Methanoperedens sp.]